MCYNYLRATRSVSLVPPAYYAHLAAFRGRSLLAPEDDSDTTSQSSAEGTLSLAKIHDNLKVCAPSPCVALSIHQSPHCVLTMERAASPVRRRPCFTPRQTALIICNANKNAGLTHVFSYQLAFLSSRRPLLQYL
jgi:hypothetical protein